MSCSSSSSMLKRGKKPLFSGSQPTPPSPPARHAVVAAPPSQILPLVTCPCCRIRTTIRLVSASELNPGRVFYKCPNHRNGRGGCNFYHWEDGDDSYVDYLVRSGIIEADVAWSGEASEDEQQEEKKKKKSEVKINIDMGEMVKKMEELIVLCKIMICILVVIFIVMLVYVVAQK